MRPSTQYLFAILLVVASIPLYMVLARSDGNRGGSATAPVAIRPSPGVSSPPKHVSMTANEAAAFEAIGAHRARCVAGVVYRTSGHVIEPWPGRVACSEFGGSYAVSATGP